jgi:hypothetical protein
MLNMNTHIKSNKGMAMIEVLPLLMIFVFLLGFGIGFFEFVHTAIMNSMSARTYAFETFDNRSDVTLFRDVKSDHYTSFTKVGNRFHSTQSELHLNETGNGLYATSREILAFRRDDRDRVLANVTVEDHNTKIYEIGARNRKGGVEASPAWVMVGYGICVNAQCGDN